MSKKKRINKVQRLDIAKSIHHLLRTECACTENDLDLIDHALKKMLPDEDTDYLVRVHKGEIPLPPQPTFAIEMEDGQVEEYSFTGHPITVALDYLNKKYGSRLGTLAWHALTSSSPQEFYKGLRMFLKTPLFQNMIEREEA